MDKMDETNENISTEIFLPASTQNKNKSKKRAISEDDKMIVEDDTGIEGSTKKNAPKTKRKKFSNAEFRKIPVPAHRLVLIFVLTSYPFDWWILSFRSFQIFRAKGELAQNI